MYICIYERKGKERDLGCWSSTACVLSFLCSLGIQKSRSEILLLGVSFVFASVHAFISILGGILEIFKKYRIV